MIKQKPMIESETLSIFDPNPPAGTWGINFGGGTNSWALAIEADRRGLKPDWCIMADTGSELPETYRMVDEFAKWCAVREWPFEVVKWIRKDGTFESIHDNCLRTEYLPSKAYRLAGCTHKWKIYPMQQWRKKNGFEKTTVAIGYDNGEESRKQAAAKRACDDPESHPSESFWYPLIAWEIDRAGCTKIVEAAGYKVGKSSCFCCPNMRPAEWEDLKKNHPDLYAMSEEIERRAIEAGNADTARLFTGGYRQKISCSCFIEDLEFGLFEKGGADAQ